MAIEDILNREIDNTTDQNTKIFFSAIVMEIVKLRNKVKRLTERDEILTKLENAGVDNWEGYSEAFSDDEENDE